MYYYGSFCTHSFKYTVTHMFIHWLICSITRPVAPSLNDVLSHPLTQSHTDFSLTHWLSQPLPCSITHPQDQCITDSLSHSFTLVSPIRIKRKVCGVHRCPPKQSFSYLNPLLVKGCSKHTFSWMIFEQMPWSHLPAYVLVKQTFKSSSRWHDFTDDITRYWGTSFLPTEQDLLELRSYLLFVVFGGFILVLFWNVHYVVLIVM